MRKTPVRYFCAVQLIIDSRSLLASLDSDGYVAEQNGRIKRTFALRAEIMGLKWRAMLALQFGALNFPRGHRRRDRDEIEDSKKASELIT